MRAMIKPQSVLLFSPNTRAMHCHAAKLYLMRKKKTKNKKAKVPKSPQVHDQPAGNPAPASTAATSEVWQSTAFIT